MLQRLQIAQDLLAGLLAVLSQPAYQQHRPAVQSALDAANAKLQGLASLETQPQAPLVPPQLVPKVPA